MNNHLDRIHHFKGTPYEIGFSVGQKLGEKLKKTFSHCIVNMADFSDMGKLHSGAAWTQREEDNDLLTEFERPDYEAAIASARSVIGDAAFDEAFAKGQAMTIEQVIQFALDDQEQ